MCTLVILRRPGHDWPLIVAANRDERTDRPWRPPGRHWPDRPEVIGGLDELAGGTWLGLNDYGVIAGVLNRLGSLGPSADFRSRGELPLEALDHAQAQDAARALGALDPAAYRPFNMVIADSRQAFWLRADGARLAVAPVPVGLSMITAHDLNDPASCRQGLYLERFRAAKAPEPENGDWEAWTTLLSARESADKADPGGAMCVVSGDGFGTVSSSLLALPAAAGGGIRPRWRFCPKTPERTLYNEVSI